MADNIDFVRVPSDGTGKRVTSKEYVDGANTSHFTQVMHLGDRTDPNIQQTIRADGSALVEFATGAPAFNAFNRLLVSNDDLLSAFKFYEGARAVGTKIDTITTGTAEVAEDTNNLSYRCRVSPGAGNKAVVASHRRFSYKPGAAITIYFVMSKNNPSQTNVVSRSGYFDDNDGLFIECRQGVFSCVIRNSVTGSPVEISVPQSQWNGDRLDGSGGDFNRSGATIDHSKMNIFYITYQYLSAGAVTFGAYVDGTPVTLHTIGNFGELSAPYMANTYLPIRFEIETTGTGQVGDTDLYTHCAAIIADGYQDLLRTPLAFENAKTLDTDADVPIISFRPSQTYFGKDNRFRYLLQYVNSYTSDVPVILTLHAGAVLSGATWGDSSLGMEFDYDATAVLGSLQYGKNFATPGQPGSINLTAVGGDNSTDGLFRKNDIAETDVWTISARRLVSSNTDVIVSGSFFQVE